MFFFTSLPFFVTTFFFVRTSNPKDIKQVVIAKSAKLSKPRINYEPLSIYGNNIVSTLKNSEWKIHRQIANPAFDESHLIYMANICVESINLLQQRWDKLIEQDNEITVDLFKEFSELTLDIIGKTGFGYDLKVLTSEKLVLTGNHKMSFKEALEMTIKEALEMRLIVPEFLRLRAFFSKTFQAIDEVKQYILEIIDSRLKDSESNQYHDLLSMLLKTNEATSDSKLKLSVDELISNAWVVLCTYTSNSFKKFLL